MKLLPATLLIPALAASAAYGAEVTVAKSPFFVSHSFSATAIPTATTPVRLPAEAWSDFEIAEIAAHGAKVVAGDTLVKFDAEKFEKALADARRAFATSEMNLAQARLDLKSLQETTPLKLDAARRAARDAKEELDYFNNTSRKASEEGAKRALERSEFALKSAQEELKQLDKMYQADDLTEETEEIILARQKFQVVQAEYGFRMAQLEHDRTLKVSIPRRAEALTAANKEAAIALAAAEEELPRKLKLAEKSLESAEINFSREQENLAKLEADGKFMTIKAPAAGWFYYGTLEDGRWSTGEMIKSLVPHGKAPLKRPFATFVPATAPLAMFAFVDEAAARALAAEQTGTATPAGRTDLAVPAKIAAAAATPEPDGRYRVRFDISWPADLAVAPGSTAEVALVSYQKADAIAVPAKAVTYTPQGWTVEVKLADGQSEKRAVKRGRTSGEQVEILDGLEEGQVVVVP